MHPAYNSVTSVPMISHWSPCDTQTDHWPLVSPPLLNFKHWALYQVKTGLPLPPSLGSYSSDGVCDNYPPPNNLPLDWSKVAWTRSTGQSMWVILVGFF